MFSFLRTNSQAKSGDHSETKDSHASPVPATQHPENHGTPVSSFSFMNSGHQSSDSMFGGMSVSSPAPAEHAPASSGFSFMSEERAVSVEKAPEPVSSFSFISEASHPAEPATSGFSFLSEPPKHDLLDEPIHHEEPVQDLKLSKVAVTKQVKKKKKFSRVGAGREEEEEIADRRLSASNLESLQENADDVPHSEPVVEHSIQNSTIEHNPDHAVDLGSHHTEAPSGFGFMSGDHSAHVEEHSEPVSSFTFLSQQEKSADPEPEEEPLPPVPSTQPPPPVSSSGSLFDDMNIVPAKEPTPAVAPVSHTHVHIHTNPPTSDSIHNIMNQFEKANTTKKAETKPEKQVVIEEGINFNVPDSLASELETVDHKLIGGFNSLRLNYLQSYETQQNLLNSLDNISIDSTQLIEKISSLESKQEILAANEDFEQADLITNEIEVLQAELKNKNQQKLNILNKLKELRKDYSQEKLNQLNSLYSLLNSLFTACDEAQSSIDVFVNKLREFETDEVTKLQIEKQRIDMEKKHCEREQEALNSENKVIEDAIKSQVGDYYQKKEAIEDQLSTVQDEIQALEQQLALKKSYESDLLKSLKSIDAKINEARKKFDRQLIRIQERLETLQKSQRECAQEENYITSTEIKLNNILKNSTKVIDDAKGLIDRKSHERNIITTVIDDLKSFSKKHNVGNNENTEVTATPLPSLGLESSWEAYEILQQQTAGANDGSSLSNHNNKVKVKMDQITEIKLGLAKLHGSLSEERIIYDTKVSKQKSLTEQVESLELAKKLHAANKRFKEAGATAKEIKEVSELKEKIEAEITQHQELITSLENEENHLNENLSLLETELANEQKLEKQYHIATLSSRIEDCNLLLYRFTKAYKQIYSNDKSSSSSSEFMGILGEIIRLYQSELTQLKSLREELCLKNGLEVPVDPPIPAEEEETIEVTPSDEVVQESSSEVKVENPEELLDLLESLGDNHKKSENENQEEEFNNGAITTELASDAVVIDVTNVEVENSNTTEANAEEEVVPEPAPEPEPEVPAIDVEAILKEIEALENEMATAAEQEDFDKAQELLDQIDAKKALLP